jgi:hypothetical protein
VYKLSKNIMEMGMRKTDGQLGKTDPRCYYKNCLKIKFNNDKKAQFKGWTYQYMKPHGIKRRL